MFYEDALTAARALELTLTSRAKDSTGGAIPMCGVPFHAGDGYIARLVRKGFRVAVCEQVEDPKKAKGLVRREVVRVVSPGTLTDAGYLEAREPAFLLALAPMHPGPGFGVALLDLSTGEFTAAEYAGEDGRAALVRRAGGPAAARDPGADRVRRGGGAVDGVAHRGAVDRRRAVDLRIRVGAPHAARSAARRRRSQGFGLDDRPAAVSAAGALVQYLRDTQKADLAHVRDISYRTGADCLIVDPTTLRNLEVIEAAGRRADRLAAARDRSHDHADGRTAAARLAAAAAGGARADPGPARRGRGLRVPRHGAGQAARDAQVASTTSSAWWRAPRSGTAGPRDLVVAAPVDRRGPPRARWCSRNSSRRSCKSLVAELDDLADIRDALDRTLLDEPPAGRARRRRHPRRRRSRARRAARHQPRRQAAHRRDGRGRAGAHRDRLLKIRYNRVFGYYIEISKSNLAQRAARLSPQADHRRRRALHHAGAQGVRREGPRRRRADRRARRSRSSRACAGGSAPRRRASRTRRAAIASLDVLGGAGRDGGRPQLHQAAGPRAATSSPRSTRAIRSSSGTWPTPSCRTTSRSTPSTSS